MSFEKTFESALWNSRLVVIVAVVASLLVSFAMFAVATLDAVHRRLDDLKGRLAKVVLLILVVKFFEYALRLHITGALELLYLAVGIALVSLAIWLSHARSMKPPPTG